MTNIYTMYPDGSGLSRLTGDICPSSDECSSGQPTWSSNGGRIAFTVSSRQRENPEGTYWKQLTTKALCPGAFSCRSNSPEWSRDGKKIAFVLFNGSEADIYVMNRDGTGIKRLTTAPGIDWRPTWSPDSQKIAFVSQRDGNSEIYVMNVDGTRQRNLTNNPATDDQPEWSPA